MELITVLLRKLMELIAFPMEKPAMYGTFHICVTAAVVFAAVLAGYAMKDKSDEARIRFLSRTGIAMFTSEVIKQLFLFFIVEGEQYNWWWFPFQLCSMPMYLSLVLPYIKKREAVYAFLVSYCAVAAVCALAYPQDMLRDYVFLTYHSFLWHGAMLMIAFILLFGKMVRFDDRTFFGAFVLFLVLAGIATCINIYGYHHTVIKGTYPNMFYITPYYRNIQPVFSVIADTLGILPGNIFYLAAVSLASYALFRIEGLLQ